MTLVSAIEEKFGITFETDDIIDFSSFLEGIKILKNIMSIFLLKFLS